MVVRVVVAGVHGHGASHLRRLAGLGHVAELVGVCDPRPVPAEVFDGPVSPDLRALIEETRADVAVLATPIHTHEELAVAALRAGAHVLLEKPPAASLDAFERIVSAAAETGRGCQVGFQSLGSLAVPAVRELLAGIGPLRGIGVAGAWPRPAAYFTRGAWSGRRRLNGVDVVDGAVTNPFAHAVCTALAVAGTPVASVECELFHANPIESDDTSALRILLADGTPLVVAVTLCAASREEPYVLFHGARGRVRLTYTTDEVQVDDGPVVKYGRADLLENLLDHVRDGTPLLVPVESARSFMQVLEAVRTAPDPLPIDPAHFHDTAGGRVVRDVRAHVHDAAERLALFSELGAPWATPLVVSGRVVASYPTAAPRPYLHPVRTLDGTAVTDVRPADHPHHLGASLAVTDLNGHNFWGGRTYVRDQGPTWLDNHGVQRHTAFTEHGPSGFTEELFWDGSDAIPLVRETRRVSARALSRGWALGFSSVLTNLTGQAVTISSSAVKGRAGAGYGGFFWRAPDGLDVFTATGSGEAAVHGSRAPWVALRGPSWTLVFAQDEDPWFVRVAEYAGVGTSLAWSAELTFEETLERHVTVVIVDGHLTAGEAEELSAEAAGV